MNRRNFLTLLAIATSATAFGAAPPAGDRGKRLLPKIFEEVTGPASDSTARIQGDGKDVALGIVVTKTGYIITKGSELRGALTVKLRDGSFSDAEYIGYHKLTDLALLKIDADDLTPAKFSPGKVAEAGNWVATTGITSEPIAVGVISAGPRKLYGQESTIENANKGYLGIRFDGTNTDAVTILEIVKGAAAEKAGLKKGDVILQVQGTKLKNRDHLPELLDNYKPGDKITVIVERKKKDEDETEELTFKLTLSPRSDMSRGDTQNAFGGELSGRRTGFPSVIQHDTIIMPRDCGGPLVDLEGRIVGMNIARAGRVETWALPIEVITPVLDDLKKGKYPAPGRTKSSTTSEPKKDPAK
jgi:serine protease Do